MLSYSKRLIKAKAFPRVPPEISGALSASNVLHTSVKADEKQFKIVLASILNKIVIGNLK